MRKLFVNCAAALRWLLTLITLVPQLATAQEFSHGIYLNAGRLDTTVPVALR